MEAGQFTGTCHNCGEPGHYANHCPKKKKTGKGQGKGGTDPLGRTKEQLAKIHCYFFHHGGCNRGEKCLYKHQSGLAKAVTDQLVRPPRRDGTAAKPAEKAPALAVAEPRGRAAEAQGARRRADSPCNGPADAQSAASRGSETTRQIKARHRVRFCPDHMNTQSCQREVNSGKCSRGLHSSSDEATRLKEAAKAAAKAEIAAKK